MRVLFTIPNFDTAGSGKALLNIAKGLDKARFEPHIMCMHDRGPFFQVVKASGIPVHIYKYTSEMKPYLNGIKNCWKVSREFKRIAPDIIHSFHYSADYSEVLAAKIAGIKWVYTKKNMNWGGDSANAWKLRTLLANGIAVQNSDMIHDFFPKIKKTFFIPRGVNIKEFEYEKGLSDLRSKYGIYPDEKIIITVANLVPVKGVEVLISAFSQLVQKVNNWRLLIVGDDQNEYADRLKALCIELNLYHKVIFSGKVSDVKSHLQMSEIFVLPTLDQGRKEGSPVSLLEAMSNGRCVLGSKVPGIKDQLKEFPESMFEPGNTNDLLLKLEKLVNLSKKELTDKGDVFFEHVHKNYSLTKELSKHEKMYRTLVKEIYNG